MKIQIKNMAAAGLLLALTAGGLLLSSCSKKAPSALVPVVNELNLDLAQEAKENPLFLNSASADIDSLTSDITVKAEFNDSLMNVEELSDALVDFYTALQLKSNPSKNLETLLNTLTSEKGTMTVELSDVYGHSRSYTMDGPKLKRLYKSAPMELNFNEVKTNVVEILSKRCEAYRARVNATSCELSIQSSFATYTLSFPSASAYANLNQGSLKGRYLSVLKPVYEDFEGFRGDIVELMQTLQIEGYRFVYKTDDDKGKELKVAIVWREL